MWVYRQISSVASSALFLASVLFHQKWEWLSPVKKPSNLLDRDDISQTLLTYCWIVNSSLNLTTRSHIILPVRFITANSQKQQHRFRTVLACKRLEAHQSWHYLIAADGRWCMACRIFVEPVIWISTGSILVILQPRWWIDSLSIQYNCQT